MFQSKSHSAKAIQLSLFLIVLLKLVHGKNQLEPKYQWRLIDFNYTDENVRAEAIRNQSFIQENVIPVGMDVHQNRLFLTFPRLKHGVPVTLGYISTDGSSLVPESPKINPYPNWDAHPSTFAGSKTQLISPIRVKVDNCNRLWVLDTGIEEGLGTPITRSLPRLIIYNLTDNEHLHTVVIPKDLLDANDSRLENFVVDSYKCDNSFAYIADTGYARLIVYSHKNNDTWRFKHNFFNFEPEAGSYNIFNVSLLTSDALFGLALGAADTSGYADLYFHPMNSYHEFNVSTAVLQNKPKMPEHKIVSILGSRGNNSQSGVSAYYTKKSIVFYTLLSKSAIGCWQTSKNYTESKVNSLNVSSDLMYPSEIATDASDHLWVLSNNFHIFQSQKLNDSAVNFQIFRGSVNEIVNGTLCEPPPTKPGSSSSSSFGPIVHIISITLLLPLLQKLI